MSKDPWQLGPTHAVLEAQAPSRWLLLGLIVSLLTSGVVASALLNITLTSHGPGKLRAAQIPRSIVSEVSGTIEEVRVASGQCVSQGAPLIRIASAGIRANLLQAESKLKAAEERSTRAHVQGGVNLSQRVRQLREKQRLLALRAKSQRLSSAAASASAQRATKLFHEGLISSLEFDARQEEERISLREAQHLEQDASETQLQIDDLSIQNSDDEFHARELLVEAKAGRDSLAFALERTTLKASQDSCVDAVVVRAGDVVNAGSVVGRLASADSPRSLVSFLPERDRATVAVGDDVRVELLQLPAGVFGTLRGRVERIALDLATPTDVSEGLGEQVALAEPSYRVTVTLLDTPERARLADRLRPGMLVDVRYRLRQQKIISFVFAPLKRLFG